MLTVVRETYAPIILQRKAAALRKSTGDDRYVSALKIEGSAIDLFKKASIRPMKMLVRSPIVLATAVSLFLPSPSQLGLIETPAIHSSRLRLPLPSVHDHY